MIVGDEIESEDVAGASGAAGVILRPMVWLWVVVVGLLLVCGGVVLDAYRHNHSASNGSLISASNPGMLVALSGIVLVAIGLLAAMSLLAFQSAGTPSEVVRRGAAVVVAWVAVIGAGVGALTYVATTDLTIGHAGHTAPPSAAVATTTASGSATAPPAANSVPGVEQRVTLRGTLTLDGAPLTARFLGAVVTTRDGRVAACQMGIATVTDGRYEIVVLAEAEAHGCGVPGSRVMLWTYPNDRALYTSVTAAWPDGAREVTFDAGFSSTAPDGARHVWTEFGGEVFARDGSRPAGGTTVEAFVGNVLCGKGSVLRDSSRYILDVAGSDAVSGCAKDATVTFRIGGQAAAETSVNDLGGGTAAHRLDLRVR